MLVCLCRGIVNSRDPLAQRAAIRSTPRARCFLFSRTHSAVWSFRHHTRRCSRRLTRKTGFTCSCAATFFACRNTGRRCSAARNTPVRNRPTRGIAARRNRLTSICDASCFPLGLHGYRTSSGCALSDTRASRRSFSTLPRCRRTIGRNGNRRWIDGYSVTTSAARARNRRRHTVPVSYTHLDVYKRQPLAYAV